MSLKCFGFCLPTPLGAKPTQRLLLSPFPVRILADPFHAISESPNYALGSGIYRCAFVADKPNKGLTHLARNLNRKACRR